MRKHRRESDPGVQIVPRGARPGRKGREEKGLHPGQREGPGSGPPPTWRVLSARRPGRGHGPYLLVIPAATPSISPQMAPVPQHLGSAAAPAVSASLAAAAGCRPAGGPRSRKRRGKGREGLSRLLPPDLANGWAGHAGARGRGEVGKEAGPVTLETPPLASGTGLRPPRAGLAPPPPRPGLGPAPSRLQHCPASSPNSVPPGIGSVLPRPATRVLGEDWRDRDAEVSPRVRDLRHRGQDWPLPPLG